MSAPEAVQMLIDDHGDVNPPFGFRRTFAEDRPYKSLLQRTGKSLYAMLSIFHWGPDDDLWMSEYSKKDFAELEKLIRYRRRTCFCIGGWRDVYEDFGRCDVSCLRDIRESYVIPRTPLKAMKDEFNG